LPLDASVEHLAATVPDLDAAVSFFEVLGFGQPRLCDGGGSHLGLRVDDVVAATAAVGSWSGVEVLGTPSFSEQGGVRRGWVYLRTPWGMHIELAEERPVGVGP
jgi:catechol 2,3-dioxygenase-like lactoylglutathione lyase family enzyme